MTTPADEAERTIHEAAAALTKAIVRAQKNGHRVSLLILDVRTKQSPVAFQYIGAKVSREKVK